MLLEASNGKTGLAYLFCILAFSFCCKDVQCYVVGGAIMPHGALILNPRNFNGSQNATDAATALHYAALDAGRFIESLGPDLLLLVTPHGLALPEPFLFYHNPSAVGSVAVDDWLPCAFPPCVYTANATLDAHLTMRLVGALAARGNRVTTLSGFGPAGAGTLPLPLAWAEIIPLYFISRAFRNRGLVPRKQQPAVGQLPTRYRRRRLAAQAARGGTDSFHNGLDDGLVGGRTADRSQRIGGERRPHLDFDDQGAGGDAGAAVGAGAGASAGAMSGAGQPNAVILSMPTRRYEHTVSMIPELLALGRSLFTQLDSLDERIAVVVSGDLAHTWDPAGPYGYSDHAALFDAAVQQWARDLDRNALLKVAAKSVGEAKSCGYPGLVLLEGLMEGVKSDNMHSVLLEYGHPSYYGMMCAVFDFQGDA